MYKRIEKCLRSGDESSHDTDILFDYGIFTPGCRRADLADMRRLQMNIDLRMPHLSSDRLFPDWNGMVAKLREAVSVIK